MEYLLFEAGGEDPPKGIVIYKNVAFFGRDLVNLEAGFGAELAVGRTIVFRDGSCQPRAGVPTRTIPP